MKNIFTIITAILITAGVWAQSPEKMTYQAVIRDASDQLLINQDMGMQISVLQGSASGTEVYVETHSPASNANGLVTIEIGTGTTSDDFAEIDWTSGPYFLKIETDPTSSGGTIYTITATSQLLSVPYALHANTSDSLVGGVSNLADNDADTRIQVEKSDDEDIIRFDIGGNERWVMDSTRLEPKNTGHSIFIGLNTGLNDDLSDNKNIFIGNVAGTNNTEGAANTIIGNYAGYNNLGGDENVFIGQSAGFGNESGSNNIYIGRATAYNNAGGSLNTYLGHFSGYTDNSSTFNVFIGAYSGYSVENGTSNVFIGKYAGYSETSVSDKLIISNSQTKNLIEGDFSNDKVTIKDVLKLTPRSTSPSDPVEGEIYVNSALHRIYCYLNGGWVALDN